MGLLLITTVIIGKDTYLSGLKRSFDPTAAQIVQELVEIQQHARNDRPSEGANEFELTMASSFQSESLADKPKYYDNTNAKVGPSPVLWMGFNFLFFFEIVECIY